MSPEEKAIDLEQANHRLSTMGLGTSNTEAKPARAKRSDAGKPRVKPAEAAPGAITREQAQRLADLIASKESRRVEWDAILEGAKFREEQFTAACVELDDFIASITAQ